MTEYIQLQRRFLAQPRGMRGVIGQVVAGQAMHQYIKSVPVLIEPGDDSVKHCAVERQLAAPVRMRPDLALMHATHGNAKKFACLLAQGACLRYRCGAEIDMGVIVGIKVFGSLGHDQAKDSKIPPSGADRGIYCVYIQLFIR